MANWLGGILVAAVLVLAGCGAETPQGAGETDTVFGDLPEAGQVPGKGRVDRGGGATAGGFPELTGSNVTEAGTGVQPQPETNR